MRKSWTVDTIGGSTGMADYRLLIV